MSKIISISEAASIAIHSMVVVAESDKPLNVPTITERIYASKHHVAKILQRLTKNGFLISSRGPNGGFSLGKQPDQITLLEIYEAIEGKITISECPISNAICPFNKCLLGNIVKMLSEGFIDYMKNNTIKDLIKVSK